MGFSGDRLEMYALMPIFHNRSWKPTEHFSSVIQSAYRTSSPIIAGNGLSCGITMHDFSPN